jgi:hypothetical protein
MNALVHDPIYASPLSRDASSSLGFSAIVAEFLSRLCVPLVTRVWTRSQEMFTIC